MTKTSRLNLLVAFLLATGAISNAHAQTKKELVQKLLQVQRPSIEAVARTLAEEPAVQVIESTKRVLQTRVPPEKREAAGKAADAEIKKYLDEAVPLVRDKAVALAPSTIGQMLEERFTEDELKQLIAWLESPLTKKYQQMGPEFQNALTQKIVTEVRALIDPKVKTMNTNVAKVLGLPPVPAAGAASAPAAPARSR